MKKILHMTAPGPITDESAFLNRRQLMSSLLISSMALGSSRLLAVENAGSSRQKNLDFRAASRENALKLTDETAATTYNNFYEFGLDKADPAKNAGKFQVRPWSVVVDGEVAKPQRFDLEQLIPFSALEERIYRMRCVEAWSMVIPWVGVSLASIIKRVEPLAKAKFVAFETLHDPNQMPGQRQGWLNLGGLEWPYREGLRLDEALHPLAFLAVGMYGKTLPPQNGAPLRLVVPWKYGFKGIKSIVRIRLMDSMPVTSWNASAPNEYGFYANVNPDVSHPRWSQSKERRIYSARLGGVERIDTLPFNGYGDQVAKLYSGMDLRRYY